jgi:putative heme uptake system protein
VSERRTFLLVDGENIDATLGTALFQRRPQPEERPRWERLTSFAETTWGQPAVGLFFLNATSGQMPLSFVQALLAMGYRPIPLAGGSDEKVVDIGIQRTLDAILDAGRGDVLLASHDADFVPHLRRLLDDGRKVGVLGLREFVSVELAGLQDQGMSFYDLEDEVGAFTAVLPRIRIIPLADFDPTRYL